ncbi:gluconeogenesis factor YvcK family protein [Garciella nitratireducens]|uniref:gluconeogenesis factor YvcK family protein n=1 Tax=Garciella nitratireducens TaxID=218205 RepID=UPI000DEA25D5|nr:gluconeogenesis factor YvcK family protein [Garciella nitratireducens]RBP44762.1 putative cofD-like protein [Garciella nitratireducens]
MNKESKEKGPKLVIIGGGTGSSVLLRGLKKYTSNITAIVTVADDGGGSGKLREDLGMLPPGDIRSCILALADTEPIMEKLLQYRFQEGSLKGQNFGNLFIAAMNEITGNFEQAVKNISDVLKVKGTVIPVTLENIILIAELENGEFVRGESQIPIVAKEKQQRIKRVFIDPSKVAPHQDAIQAIQEADGIILGPGSLYTSIIPNLLVDGLSDAISKAKGVKFYVSNIMTQPGETDCYTVIDHVKAILNHVKYSNRNSMVEYIIANNGSIPEYLLQKYREDGSTMVIYNNDKQLKKYPYSFIVDDFVEIKKDYVRHNADKVARIICNLIKEKKLAKEELSFTDSII